MRYRGELDYGLRKAPDAGIADVEEFLRRWSPQSQAFAVMEKSMFDDLKTPRRADALGGGTTPIASWWRGNELDHLGH